MVQQMTQSKHFKMAMLGLHEFDQTLPLNEFKE
jgi:hypothetical protein